MNRTKQKFIEVYAHWVGLTQPTVMGVLHAISTKGKEIFSLSDNSQDLELAKEVAEFFRIKPNKADTIIQEVVKIVKNWRKEASMLGISKREQEQMARAFRVVS